MNIARKKKAFTLIELLVVVLILAILSAVALPLYLKSVFESEYQACKTNMKTIATAVQAHHVRNRTLPYFDGHIDSGKTGPGNDLEDLMSPPYCPGDGSDYHVDNIGANGRDGFKVRCHDKTHVFSWRNGIFQNSK